MKRLGIVTVAVMMLALGTMFVIANQDAESTTGATGQLTPTTINGVATQGGNVTENNVSSNASTGNWQGFYGNVSGNLQLGDGSTLFYDWGAVTFTAVYASPDNAVTWGGLTAIDTTGEKETKDTEYGFASADSDSINQTISGATCTAGSEITNSGGVTPNGAGAWETCIAEDAAGVANTVLGTNVASGTGFDGSTWDYQLMVPVNATGQLYYFYLEA